MRNLKEERLFWDDFAEEYAEIQEESQVNIQRDVPSFLLAKKILPTHTFLDLAGGIGKYIPEIIEHVGQYTLVDFSEKMLEIAKSKYNYPNLDLLHDDQESFLKQTQKQNYDIVFSAMNPALTTPSELEEMMRIANKYVCLLRVIEEKDTMFSSLETPAEEWQWMEIYKTWLSKPYCTQTFTYTSKEKISKEFFVDYFSIDFPSAKIQTLVDDLFKETTEKINETTITFELLIIEI